MTDRETLLPAFARLFNDGSYETSSGRPIEVSLFKANSGEITGELKVRVLHGTSIDGNKPDPQLVTPAADHWINDLNQSVEQAVFRKTDSVPVATTYIGIVTSREMAQCLGWPQREIGFADVVALAVDPQGWASYGCSRPEWGRDAMVAFTYPNRSSTSRSVLYTLYSIAVGKPASLLTLADVSQPDVTAYVKRFQTSVDCYVPDTLDLNIKILSAPPCAHFYFIAEDNLVKLYQGKVQIPVGDRTQPRALERDMVMIYPKEGSIIHNHSAHFVNASFSDEEQRDAADVWTSFLREDSQQEVFMQEGFRRTSGERCIDPLGSPFSPCSIAPRALIYPDDIDPAVAAAILRAWG